MKYNVHLYVQVRVKVADVEAESFPSALLAASQAVDLDRLLKQDRPILHSDLPNGMFVDHVEYADGGVEETLIDPLLPDGTVDTANSVTLRRPEGGDAWLEDWAASLVESDKAATAAVAAQERLLALAERIRQGLEAQEPGIATTDIVGYAYVLLSRGEGPRELWFSMSAGKGDFDGFNMHACTSLSDVADFCLGAEDLNVTSDAMEAWLANPEYMVLTDEAQEEIRFEMGKLDEIRAERAAAAAAVTGSAT